MSTPDTSFADGSPGMRTVSVIITPLVVVSVVFPVLAAVSIYLRLIAKRRIRQPYHADDWWIIATWVNASLFEDHVPCHYSADQDQFLTFPMSLLFWVFAAKSGVDAYDIDSLQGTYDSLEVRGCVVGMCLFSPIETDIPTSSAQVAYLTACILQFPLSSVKISVLLFYKRIFAISQRLSVCVWIAIGVIVVWCIVFTVVSP